MLPWLGRGAVPHSTEVLQSIFDSSVDGIICTDALGTITAFSPAAERIFGYSAESAVGQNVSMLMAEPDRAQHGQYIARYCDTGIPTVLGIGRAVSALRRDGSSVPIFLSVGEFRIDGQRMFTGIVSDRSGEAAAQTRLVESETRFQQLASSIDEVFILRTTAPYRYLYISPAIEKIFGLTAAEAIADPALFFSFAHPDDVEFVRKTMQDAQFEASVEVEYRIVRADGETRWVWTRYNRVAMTSEGEELLAIVVSDITERKLAEELAVRARSEAERANAAKTEFLSRMSHELRTPLNAILGFAQLLELDELDDGQRDSVAHISRAGRHLLQLINEVLDIARIDAGHVSLSLEPVRVADVVNEVIGLVRPMANARELGISLPGESCGGLHVLADRHRLSQALLNLLSNAIKYNIDGGRIDVSCARTNDGMTSITVTDTGIGIGQVDLDRVFIPFDRLGMDHSDIEGAGIGLALSDSLVRAMRGRMQVQSQPGVGSSFSILLPSVDAEFHTELGAAGDPFAFQRDLAGMQTHPLRDLVVAYVEDNPANMRLMEAVATRVPGVRLIQAQQGRRGLELIGSHHPHLIMLDLHLPDMSGEDMLRILRSDPLTQRTPILMVSADASAGRVQRLLDLGATGYLTKPINVSEVLGWFTRVQSELPDGPE